MEMFKLYRDCILRPILGDDIKLIDKDEHESASSGNDEEDICNMSAATNRNNVDNIGSLGRKLAAAQKQETKETRQTNNNKVKRKYPSISVNRPADDMLDLSGPKLYEGCTILLFFHQIIGQLNWSGKPLYFSILYKLAIAFLFIFTMYDNLFNKILKSNLINENFRNPIFRFISLLALAFSLVHWLINFSTNLFDLCPMFKILTTPKLCFVNRRILQISGNKTLRVTLSFYIYHSVLLSMLIFPNLDEFLNKFRLDKFLADVFIITSGLYNLIGMAQLDFYIRSTFGFWLIALKFNLEHRFAFLHNYQRRLKLPHRASSGSNSMNSGGTSADGEQITCDDIASRYCTVTRKNSTRSQEQLEKQFRKTYKFVTLDEIQNNLNNMDDHLEVWRTIQTSSVLAITLNAFLINGTLLLVAYNLLANKGDFYHGLILLLVAVNHTIMIFFCYIGDSWISYALRSFVRTVEDEYFLQGGDEPNKRPSANSAGSILPPNWHHVERTAADTSDSLQDCDSRRICFAKQHQSFLIKKEDVLFCREFVHQFEHHLATPWSKMTVKTHLQTLGTFVTLIAAQIIFDREH